MFSGFAQDRLIHRRRDEDALVMKIDQRFDQLGRSLRLFLFVMLVLFIHNNLHWVKCAREQKSSLFKKLFGAFVAPENFQRVMQPGFHCAQGNCQGYRNFSQAETIHKAEQQNLPMFL